MYSIDGIDLDHCGIYFSSNKASLIERHLYYACFINNNNNKNNNNIAYQITTTSGSHDCTVLIHKKNNICYIVDKFSSITSPLSMILYKIEKKSNILSYNNNKLQYIMKICDNIDLDIRFQKPYYKQSLISPILQVIRSDDDKVDLYCAIYLPPNHHYNSNNNNSDRRNDNNNVITINNNNYSTQYSPNAAIISVYGGPHVQRVTNNWLLTVDLRAQYLAQLGFIVIKCDNRGSYRRGIQFEGALLHDMGNIEIIDQVTAVKYYSKIGLIDELRVGMFGWSYGGYMSAMSLCR